MKKRLALVLTLLGLSTLGLFQNCSKFDSTTGAAGSANSSSVTTVDHDTPHIMPNTTASTPGSDMSFSVHDDELSTSAQFVWSYLFNGVSGTGCTVKTSAETSDYIINCPIAGQLQINVAVMDGSNAVTVSPYIITLTEPAGTTSSGQINMTVTFTIPAGTGTGPWNTAATQVEAFIGQTLTIQNNDSVGQELHTNGVPFAHGALIQPGSSGSEVVLSAYTIQANGVLYNHLVGTSAPFYLVAYDGQALYAQNCASCHSALATSQVKGALVSSITSAIAGDAGMHTASLMALTTRQIEAISYALGGK